MSVLKEGVAYVVAGCLGIALGQLIVNGRVVIGPALVIALIGSIIVGLWASPLKRR